MLKVPESVMTSSPSLRCRENVPRGNKIGCMAGIFHFLSTYHSHRRFLTFCGKQETNKQRKASYCKRKCRSNLKDENKNNSVKNTTKIEIKTRLSPPANIISPPHVAAEVAVEVERKKLVAALEKCNEDLKAISSIINSLRSNDQKPFSSSDYVVFGLRNYKFANTRAMRNGMVSQQKKPQSMKNFFEKVTSQVISAHISKIPPLWGSKAKLDSVNEVCNDYVWGIDREFGKFGWILTDHIFRYLVDEFIKELSDDFVYLSFSTRYRNILQLRNARTSGSLIPSLPLESCKRRLSF